MELDTQEFVIKTGVAIIAGFLMGLERQVKNKPAGLKTNTLVALGATIFILVGMTFEGDDETDLTRVIGQVVVGVGFLGTGAILQQRDGEHVNGLATAATIWCSAASGALAAIGAFVPLFIFTCAVVMVNVIFGYLTGKIP